jgi:hypothetical protein
MERRGQIPGRCGTCEHFVENGKSCVHLEFVDSYGTYVPQPIDYIRYANDYGENHCKNYKVGKNEGREADKGQ